jgi:peroxiredoxin
VLHIGDEVPDFTLPLAYADGRRDPVSFRSLLGRGPVVLSFFPLAFTRTCTVQMCEMRDRAAALDGLGVQAFGFSCDSAYTNVAYAREQGLRHGIFSDPNREAVDALWATQTVVGVHRVPKRGYLVVGRDGRVAEKWVTDAPGEWIGIQALEAAVARAK